MTTDTLELPELPEPTLETNGDVFGHENVEGYTAAQMRAYATAAVLAEREMQSKRAAGAPEADELKQATRAGFMFGWKAASVWANREDLIADIGSPAYEKDCAAACGAIRNKE